MKEFNARTDNQRFSALIFGGDCPAWHSRRRPWRLGHHFRTGQAEMREIAMGSRHSPGDQNPNLCRSRLDAGQIQLANDLLETS